MASLVTPSYRNLDNLVRCPPAVLHLVEAVATVPRSLSLYFREQTTKMAGAGKRWDRTLVSVKGAVSTA